ISAPLKSLKINLVDRCSEMLWYDGFQHKSTSKDKNPIIIGNNYTTSPNRRAKKSCEKCPRPGQKPGLASLSFHHVVSLILDGLLHLIDRKSTRLNSSHVKNSLSIFCMLIKSYLTY